MTAGTGVCGGQRGGRLSYGPKGPATAGVGGRDLASERLLGGTGYFHSFS